MSANNPIHISSLQGRGCERDRNICNSDFLMIQLKQNTEFLFQYLKVLRRMSYGKGQSFSQF